MTQKISLQERIEQPRFDELEATPAIFLLLDTYLNSFTQINPDCKDIMTRILSDVSFHYDEIIQRIIDYVDHIDYVDDETNVLLELLILPFSYLAPD